MKRKINFIYKLSPNYSKRNSKNKVKYIILHYTGTKKLADALNLFKNPRSKVSCHWLISSKGKIYKIVDEENVAWHAGISYWKNEKMLNNISIGIELYNKGHGTGYEIFPAAQMSALVQLLENLLKKYKISKKNVLAHSDIAPERKCDPGELFDWQKLAKKNLAYWPLLSKTKITKKLSLQLGQANENILYIKKKLNKIGYKCNLNNAFDINLKLVIEAFQRRFLPSQINGIIDEKVYFRILQISKNA